MRRCMGCMEEYDEKYDVCPSCGYINDTSIDEAIQMYPGNMIGNRFIVGKVIGSGGFGVTYIGWDTVLNSKIAIREYLPSEFSTRIPGQMSVTVFDGEKGEQFKSGLDKFVDEAKRLAKFNNCPGIVKVFDSFYENNTAYIIMEYLDGEVLSDVLARQGIFPVDTAIGMVLPIMESLKQVHKEGIIHRDVAPDNIMLTKKGELKLIDFAAARYATTSHSRSLSVIVKQGYSPEEQYRSRGDQGAHTDVYSIAATLYKMITGVTPPDALERRAYFEGKKKDILVPLVKNCKTIPVNTENAILNALNVRIEDRTSDMETFIEELTTDGPVKRIKGKIKKIDILRWPLWLKITVPVAAALVITLSTLFALGIIGFDANVQTEIEIPDGMTRVPALVNQRVEVAEAMVNEEQLTYYIAGKEYSMVVPKDYVLTQSSPSGNITAVNSVIEVMVSGGPELRAVPNVVGFSKEEADALIEEAGFVAEYSTEYNLAVPKGYIASQELNSGEYIPMGTTMKIVVSMGKDPMNEGESKKVTVPEFVGLDYEDAIRLAIDSEVSITISEKKYSKEFDENVVMGQNIAPDTEMMNDKPIELVVSLGVHYVKVPDVTYMKEEVAIKLLTDNSLTYKIEYAESEIVGKDLVITQSLADTEMVEAGTEVTITVSTGKGTFPVPDVTGKSESKAKELLESQGLIVNISYENSDKVKSGNVISQSIKAGKEVTSATEIGIVVSAGEKLYEVPDVIGEKKNDAYDQLKKGKFEIQIGEDYNEEIEEGKVFSQTLKAGSMHKEGTEIVIMISKGKQPLTITFDGNGGKVNKESITSYLGEGYGKLPDATRTGYTFKGWYTAKNGGSKITDKSKVTVKANQTLYASWEANTYTVTLKGNGSKYEESVKVVYDSAYGVLPIIEREGYGFIGWWTSKDGGEEVSSASIVKLAKDHTLYAHWEAGAVTVGLNFGGGDCDKSVLAVTFDEPYGALPIPTKEGHTFAGWWTKATGGEEVKSETIVKNSKPHMIYAHWDVNTYTINFEEEGGSSVDNKEVEYDSGIGVLPEPTKTGYAFDGWYTEKDGKGTKVSEATVMKDDVTYYAYWVIKTYTVRFDACGGKAVDSVLANYGTTISVPSTSREHYSFVSWNTKSDGTGENLTESTVITGDVTYYAIWKVNSYTVTFNAQGGSCSTSSLSVVYNNTVSVPTATKSYYTFKGWNTKSDGNGYALTSTTKITENVTYYAIWTSKPTSDWVLASSVPSGGKVVSTKYKYTQTTTNTTGVTPSGYTYKSKSKTGEKWIKTTSNQYITDTSNIYWQDTRNYEGATINNLTYVPQEYSNETGYSVLTTYKVNNYYFYYHWCRGANHGSINRLINDYYTDEFWKFHWHLCHGELDMTSENTWKRDDDNWCTDTWHWFRRELYRYDYAEYEYIYTYTYTKEVEAVQTNAPSGSNISNVRKYVKYIPK